MFFLIRSSTVCADACAQNRKARDRVRVSNRRIIEKFSLWNCSSFILAEFCIRLWPRLSFRELATRVYAAHIAGSTILPLAAGLRNDSTLTDEHASQRMRMPQ